MKFIHSINPYLVFALTIALFYGNTLQNGFVYDDVSFIQNNGLIKSAGNIPKILSGCITSDATNDCQNSGVYYHPLLFLQLTLINQISPEPWFFHFVNLIMLFIGACLVYKLLETLSGKGFWPLIGALLFLVNPVNSEPGNFVSTVNDHYLLIFFILSFLSYIKFSKTRKTKYLILALIFYFLDLLAKEAAIFLFIPMVLYEYLFNDESTRDLTVGVSSLDRTSSDSGKPTTLQSGFYRDKKFTLKNRTFYKPFLLFLISLVSYLFLRLIIFGRLVHDLPGYHNLKLSEQFLTSLAIYPLYLIKLIYPLPLNAQHDPPVVKIVDWRFFASIIFWSGNFYLVYLAFKKKLKLTLLGFSLIFLSLLPILLLINKIGRFILSERYLYLATVGFSLVLVDLIPRVINLFKKSLSVNIKKTVLLLVTCYLLLSWWTVFQRNKDWHDELSFNKSIARYAKENFGVHYNLGVNYLNLNELDLAEQSFNRTLSINPDFWQARYNLASTYLKKGNLSRAMDEYEIVVKIDPGNKSALNALENLNLISSGTRSGQLKMEANLINFNSGLISFNYPVFLKLSEAEDKLVLTDGLSFRIELERGQKPDTQSYNNYLQSRKENYGRAIKEGLAQVPQFDYSYAKVWNDNGIAKLQLFLFKGTKVIRVLVYPQDSPLMKEFDKVLGSVKIN